MRFLSLFAGIGGFDLGLERANWQCVGQVEIDPFCQKVLAKHWPDVWRWSDVKTLTGAQVAEHCGTIKALVGGVPCQPASVAGKRKGAADDRWLWPDFLRLVSEIKPVWVLAENPRGVLSLPVEGMQFSEWIAREFAARGYELLPVELAAEDVGAPHRRERIFFVAYSNRDGWARGDRGASARTDDPFRWSKCAAHAGTSGDGSSRGELSQMEATAMADADRLREQQSSRIVAKGGQWTGDGSKSLADTFHTGLERQRNGTLSTGAEIALSAGFGSHQWPSRPGQPQYDWEEPRTIELQVGESVAGLPVRLARRHRVGALKALGNAVVPQVAEVIGRAILQMEVAA